MAEDHDFPVESLTEREHEVLQYVAAGYSNRQIAKELYLAVGTVKTHIHNTYGKLGVESRTQAIARASHQGLLDEQLNYQLPPHIDEDELENPYKGLRAFQESDAGEFFGRDVLIDNLLARLREDVPLQRFLAVVGPSGSGKSSVIKAGLLPKLRQDALPNSSQWLITDMLPGTHPIEELAIALNRIAEQPNLDLARHIQANKRGLVSSARVLFPTQNDILLVVDQFEELFTLVDNPDRARLFLDLIYQAVTDKRSPLRIIVTLRADFYDRPLMYPDFSELIRQRTEVVLPLKPNEIEKAILGPIEQLGIRAESGLATKIVADVHEQPGALPLLQYALTELFDQRTNHTLSLQSYNQLGGTLGILASRADEVYSALNASQQEAARQMFLRLITLGEGTEDTRRRTLRSELMSIDERDMEIVIDAFDESRLLTFDYDPVSKEPTVEVAHEAIIREWGTLRNWLDASRDDIRQQRLLNAATQEWRKADQEVSYVLQGSRLSQFVQWAEQTTLALTLEEDQFLQASLVEQEHQAQLEAERRAQRHALERRVRRILTALVAVLLIAAIVAGGLAVFALNESSEATDAKSTSDANAVIAEQSAERSQSLFLASAAEDALDEGNTDLALILILEAYNLALPRKHLMMATRI